MVFRFIRSLPKIWKKIIFFISWVVFALSFALLLAGVINDGNNELAKAFYEPNGKQNAIGLAFFVISMALLFILSFIMATAASIITLKMLEANAEETYNDRLITRLHLDQFKKWISQVEIDNKNKGLNKANEFAKIIAPEKNRLNAIKKQMETASKTPENPPINAPVAPLINENVINYPRRH